MKKTIAIIGSARREGNTGKMIDWIASELDIAVIDLNTLNISPFDYEHKNKQDDFLPTIHQILQYENIIFASPVYWYAMSAPMKIFFDRISDLLSLDELKDVGRALRNKVGYVVSTSISKQPDESFLNSFVDTFGYLGMGFGAFVHADCKEGFNAEHYQRDVENFIGKLVGNKSESLTSSKVCNQ